MKSKKITYQQRLQKLTFGLAMLLVLTLFLNNIAGCFLYFMQEKENNWVANIEKKEAQVFKIIKFNASVYTFMDDTELETVNQNIEIDHNIFYVFQKQIKNNVLILYYLPNKNVPQTVINISKIVEKDNDFVQNPVKKGLQKAYKTFDKDYIASHFHINTNSIRLYSKTSRIKSFENLQTLTGFFFKDIAPPKISLT